MDLYNSHRTGYPTKQAQGTQTNTQSRSVTEVSGSRLPSTTEQGKPLELSDGQILKGQVLDHRYNEVTIQLSPGKQTLTARLSGDIPLSIGQEAAFTVTVDPSGSYVLKYLPENSSTQFDATIGKALTAAGFPMTDRNKALVAELLMNRLPIDKQTLQNLIRVALLNPSSNPKTLILMYKNNLPLTPENIKQFEAYQKGTHQIGDGLEAITKQIGQLLTPEALELPSSNYSVDLALQKNQLLLTILSAASSDPAQEPSTLRDSFSQTQLNQLSKLFEQYRKDNTTFPAEDTSVLAAKIQNGSLSLSETAELFTKLLGANIKQEISQGTSGEVPQSTVTKEDLSLISTLIEESENQPNSSLPLSKVLTAQECVSLATILKDTPDLSNPPLMKDLISKGSLTLKELFTALREQLSQLDKTTAAKLIQSPEYIKLFEAAFLKKWSITPNRFAEKAAVTSFFHDLNEDLEQLHGLTKEQPGLSDRDPLQQPVQNLKENLQFMKALNQVFTYLQLPVQFKNQTASAELYVLSKKRTKESKSEALSVLLHLELVNLGLINIYLNLQDNRQLQADFYIEDKETGRLVNEHLTDLAEALQKKSYHLKATVKDNYNKLDFSKDFIEQNSLDSQVKRYTFDIRT